LQLGDPIEAVSDFFDRGGDVLYLILAVTFLMWVLILERQWYYRRLSPGAATAALDGWNPRRDRTSWYAMQIRGELISRVRNGLEHSLLVVKSLVAVCPLLGLLGTVTGMIEVFDVMAIAGSGNVRGMAGGISKATLPTMAGMVAALSGLIFSVQLERRAKREGRQMSDRLVLSYD